MTPLTAAHGHRRANGARWVSRPRWWSSRSWPFGWAADCSAGTRCRLPRRHRRPGPFARRRSSSRPSPSRPWRLHGFVSEELTEGKIAVNARPRDAGVLALFGPGDAGHRRIGRYRQSRRAARDARGLGVRAGAERSAAPRRLRSSSRASTRPASTRCTMPRAAACRTGSRRRRTWRRRDRAERGAQPAENSRQVRRARSTRSRRRDSIEPGGDA